MNAVDWFPAWFTLTLAITWTVAGVILILVGWLGLPRHPEETPDDDTVRGSPTGRVVGGALLGAAATIVAAYTIARGPTWAGDGIAFALGAFPALIGYLIAYNYGQLWHVLVHWFWEVFSVAFSLSLGQAHQVGKISERLSRFLWAHRAYALVNTTALAVTAAVGAFAGWLSTSGRWRVSGVLTYMGLDLVALGLIGFSIVMVESANGPIAQGLGLWLVGVELFGLSLFLAYQFYTLEYLTGRSQDAVRAPTNIDPNWNPTVLVQVASYNEPPKIVLDCLAALKMLRYPADRLTVQLVDDSTDPKIVEELRSICIGAGVQFEHRVHRRGFKGGALNDGLAAVSPAPDLVAIVDADYVVHPDFLRRAVQPFRNPQIGFVQTPQAYRNAQSGTFARWYALADAYFYQVVQPVRARVQSLIFCGTMGIVRTEALRSCYGWSEECVTEDAELSLRMLWKGWKGKYLPKTLGWGLAPEEMTAVRSQHRRWAFGGLQLLRMNRMRLADPDLTPRQRRDFRMGGWFWMDGLFVVSLTAALGVIVVATWFGIHLPLQSTAALAIVGSAPLLLMLDGIFKIRIAMRSSTRVTYRDVLGIMGFWYAIKINDLRAALRGWSGARIAFVRTPKETSSTASAAEALRSAIRAAPAETAVGTVLSGLVAITAFRWGVFTGAHVTIPEWLLLGWLAFYAMVFFSAPLFDFYSRRARRAPGRPPGPPRGLPDPAPRAPLGARPSVEPAA